jgi:hypothetical protein
VSRVNILAQKHLTGESVLFHRKYKKGLTYETEQISDVLSHCEYVTRNHKHC